MRAVYTFDVDTEEDRWNAFRQGEQSMAVIVEMLEWLGRIEKYEHSSPTPQTVKTVMLDMIDRQGLVI